MIYSIIHDHIQLILHTTIIYIYIYIYIYTNTHCRETITGCQAFNNGLKSIQINLYRLFSLFSDGGCDISSM